MEGRRCGREFEGRLHCSLLLSLSLNVRTVLTIPDLHSFPACVSRQELPRRLSRCCTQRSRARAFKPNTRLRRAVSQQADSRKVGSGSWRWPHGPPLLLWSVWTRSLSSSLAARLNRYTAAARSGTPRGCVCGRSRWLPCKPLRNPTAGPRRRTGMGPNRACCGAAALAGPVVRPGGYAARRCCPSRCRAFWPRLY